jgi:Tfp pilus assembly protein PilO
MALNQRERVLLGTIITLTVLGGNYFLLASLAGRWQTLRAQLATSHRELASIQATIQRAPQEQKEYDQLRQNFSQKSERFQQASDVLSSINEVASTSGILLKDRRTMQPVEKDVYRELPVQCGFDATIETLVKFLYGLQTSSGFMSIEELQVTAQPDNPSILRCSMRLQALAAKSGSSKS